MDLNRFKDQEFILVEGNTKDFETIYADMLGQFHADELCPYDWFTDLIKNKKYKLLLYKQKEGQEIVGYALMYPAKQANVVWLDYLAILPEYHSCGFGSRIFRDIGAFYCGPYDGVILCAERVDPEDPALAKQQTRRLAFYERLGVRTLHADFCWPCQNEGAVPMHLLFWPRADVTALSAQKQKKAVEEIFSEVLAYLPHCQRLLREMEPSMQDEVFTK